MSMPRLETLKALIGNDDYAVDSHAVAEAILSRLLARRVLPANGDGGRGLGFGGAPSPSTG